MKYIAVGEAKAKLSQCIAESQREPVVILSHGKPAAMVVGLSGMRLEEVTKDDADLLALLRERAQSKSKPIPWEQAKKELARESRARKRR